MKAGLSLIPFDAHSGTVCLRGAQTPSQTISSAPVHSLSSEGFVFHPPVAVFDLAKHINRILSRSRSHSRSPLSPLSSRSPSQYSEIRLYDNRHSLKKTCFFILIIVILLFFCYCGAGLLFLCRFRDFE